MVGFIDTPHGRLINARSAGDQNDEVSDRDPSPWVDYKIRRSEEEKRGLAAFCVRHMLQDVDGPALVVQLASGTTNTYVMDQMISALSEEDLALDLTVVTTNLTVMELGRDALRHRKRVDSLQVIVTGGTTNWSLHSLLGEHAAMGVASPSYYPDYVVFGAKGISFRDGRLRLLYQFERELATQRAYATRPTYERIVLCDDSKLRERVGFELPVDPADLMRDADRLTFVLTRPADEEPDWFSREKKGFIDLAEAIRSRLDAKSRTEKKVRLFVVGDDGRTTEKIDG